MEKNVIVVDEQGNIYEATYPKRAKGLVKNGRARFVGENKICLACPPENLMEDNKMTDLKQNQEDEIISEAEKTAEEAAERIKAFENKSAELASDSSDSNGQYTLDYALKQLEKVREESNAFASKMMVFLGDSESGGPGDVGTQAIFEAQKALIENQNKIYQQSIDFYTKMISDLKIDSSERKVQRNQFYELIIALCAQDNGSAELPDLEKIWKIANL